MLWGGSLGLVCAGLFPGIFDDGVVVIGAMGDVEICWWRWRSNHWARDWRGVR